MATRRVTLRSCGTGGLKWYWLSVTEAYTQTGAELKRTFACGGQFARATYLPRRTMLDASPSFFHTPAVPQSTQPSRLEIFARHLSLQALTPPASQSSLLAAFVSPLSPQIRALFFSEVLLIFPVHAPAT